MMFVKITQTKPDEYIVQFFTTPDNKLIALMKTKTLHEAKRVAKTIAPGSKVYVDNINQSPDPLIEKWS